VSALHVESAGRGGPPLVLVHGWGMNAAAWGDFAAHLAERHQVYRVELPGHGRSAWAGPDSLADWAAAVLDSVPAGAVWLGWSLGVAVALQAALDAPGAVRGLVLVAGTPRFVQGGGWSHAMAPAVLEQFTASLLADPGATVERFLALQVRGAEDASGTLRRLKAALRALPPAQPQALETGLQLLRDTDLRPRLKALRPPALWLLGERDTLVPAGMGWDLAEWLPAARVQVVEGAGHAPFLSHPRQLLTSVAAFAEALDA
jgi:pimeloyl-[acyl-carrier protein] methyl ester esterase